MADATQNQPFQCQIYFWQYVDDLSAKSLAERSCWLSSNHIALLAACLPHWFPPFFFGVQATSVDGVSPFQNRWAHRVYPWYPRRALPLYSRACHTQSFAFYACDAAFFSIQWRQYSQFKRFGERWLLWCVWRCLLLLFFEPLGSSIPVSGVAMGWGWSRGWCWAGWGWVFGFVLFLFFCSAGAQIVLNVPIFLNGSKTSLCDMAWLYLGCSCSWFVGTPAEVLHWMMLVRTSYFMVDLGIGSYWVYHTK